MTNNYHMDTRLVHDDSDFEEGAVNKPIYQTSAFSYKTAEELKKVFNQEAEGYTYSRVNNPTNNALGKKINQLEGGLGSVVCASGMASISTAILSLVSTGDEIITTRNLFGGTYNFLKDNLAQWGVKTRFIKGTDLQEFRDTINNKTKLIFLETISNPCLEIPDIEAVSKIAHKNEIPLFVDNTFMTPYIFKPREYGADVVIHSTSKFINGSSNSIGGIIVDLDTFNWNQDKFSVLEKYKEYGPFAFLAKIRQDTFRNLGGCASPFNSYLNQLGLGTLAIRMEKHCENALNLAQFLKQDKRIKNVTYPGLEGNPFHKLAQKQFGDKFGGLLNFELENQKESFQFIDNLNLALNAPNLGDIRTLVIHPASTIYSSLSEKECSQLGVASGLIRVSVGIENKKDIIKDFDQALSVI